MTCPNKTLPIVEPPTSNELPRFWRSLDELEHSADFVQRLGEEFPRHASIWDDRTDRRRFLQLMGASMALAGAQGCSSPPQEPIVPYVKPPVEMTPGTPMYFATAMPRPGGGIGLVATSHMGRPTKVEGNPLHPASLGGSDAQAQASVLSLYDPDRSQTVRRLGAIATWEALVESVRDALRSTDGGAGVRVLSHRIISPTLARQREALLDGYPAAKWIQYEPVAAASEPPTVAQPVYRLAEADVVLSLDADFLHEGGGAVRYARDFMNRRSDSSEGDPNRLYVVESTCTATGATADHRLPLKPSDVARYAQAVATRLGIGNGDGSSDLAGLDEKWITAVADDLEAHRGRALVVVGDAQPARVHALGRAMNDALGGVGATVDYIAPIWPTGGADADLAALAEELDAGVVKLLVILEANPAYDAPPELNFAARLRKTEQTVHYGPYDDETAELCRWHVPATHYLESWSDVRAYDGTAAIVQPLIAPLYGAKTVHEVLSALIDESPQAGYDLVRATWEERFGEDFEQRWQTSLRDGVLEGTAAVPQAVPLGGEALGDLPAVAVSGDDRLELALHGDPSIGDGRYANNGWLQELPKPLSKLTWENAALMAPATAAEMGFETGDLVRLEVDGREELAPVLVLPGHPPGAVTCHYGYGRTRAGTTGSNLGFNAFRLRSAGGGSTFPSVRLTATGQRVELAQTQKHHEIDGRNIVHSATLAELRADPHSILPEVAHHATPSLLPEVPYEGFAWGMAIDLSKCHGCNACVIACQAENNVPIVGKEGVLRGREMHWLRLDTYYAGTPESPEAINQPMLCQHCEKAPCEVVCPVAATTHSDEGLNEMTYNRCIGTRYCSNNCPYKVRRFNFFQYQDETTPVLKMLRNPDVTVRTRGVMEKCTYCVQRINHARIDAKKTAVGSDDPPTIADGSLQTACQQACPSQAIVFGDINDSESRVARLKADVRNYGALSETGTQPRTTYLVRIRNENPELG